MTTPSGRIAVLAEIGYNAYGGSVGWAGPDGGPMLVWTDLPYAERDAWLAATEAVYKKLTTPERVPGQ